MKSMLSFLFLFFAVIALQCAADESEVSGNLRKAKSDVERESALDTVAYINRLNYAYTVMKTYHNVIAVQEEYEKLSLDRVDVTKIPSFTYNNTAMLELIKDLIDKLKQLKMNEEDHKYYLSVMEDSRRRAKKEMWIKVVTSTPRALEDAKNVIVKQTENGGDSYTVSAEAAVTLLGDLIAGPVTAVTDYEKTLDELRSSNARHHFEYQRKREDEVHEANKRLLDAEYAFVHEKNLTKEDVVTPDELRSLVDTLKKGTPQRVYCLLNTPEMQRHYARFSSYWHYLASFAVACGEYDVAIAAADRFFAEHRGLIKVDPMVANTAVSEVSALVGSKSRDYEKIRRLLKKICDINYNNKNADWSYFCADVNYHYLNDTQEALRLLETSIAFIEGDFENRLLTYRNQYAEAEQPVGENDIPKDIDLMRARTLYGDILAERKSRDLAREMAGICAGQTTAAIEKLFYLGRVRISDLWKEAEKDVLAIRLTYQRPRFKWSKFQVQIPVSWFLLGEVETALVLHKGLSQSVRIGEEKSERTIRKNDAGVGSDVVTLNFRCKEKQLAGVDAVTLEFPHKTWPIKVDYKPTLDFDVQSGKDRNDETKFVPVVIDFIGERKDLMKPSADVERAIMSEQMKDYSASLVPFQFGTVNFSTNFLTSLAIDQARCFTVAYTNITPMETKIRLNVAYFNAYGAKLCQVESDREISGEEGGVWNLAWPDEMKECEKPKFVLFQYHVDETAWNWAKGKLRSYRKLLDFGHKK